MAIKSATLLVIMLTFTMSMQSLAQQPNDTSSVSSIKSLSYAVYKLEIKDTQWIKGKSSFLYNAYPIHYPNSELFYDKEGRMIKDENRNQIDTTYYNLADQKVKTIIYFPASKDSIVISYIYDQHGNMTAKKMKASAPKLAYYSDGNYYSHESIIDNVYTNYYLSGNDSSYPSAYEKQQLELNHYYRLFDAENKLIEEKYLSCVKNPFPYKEDSIIHSISYRYNEENRLSEVSTNKQYNNAIGISYSISSSEQHRYPDQGLSHEISYFNQGQLSRKELIKKNDKGMLIEYSIHWINPDRTSTYVYNDKAELVRYTATKKSKTLRDIRLEYRYNPHGDWIQCAHFDKKDKPLYLIERSIRYYP
jgi:hypothetical protein